LADEKEVDMSKDWHGTLALILSIAALGHATYIAGKQHDVEAVKLAYAPGLTKEQNEELLQVVANPERHAVEEMRELKQRAQRAEEELSQLRLRSIQAPTCPGSTLGVWPLFMRAAREMVAPSSATRFAEVLGGPQLARRAANVLESAGARPP
jgi:hypothetical protein